MKNIVKLFVVSTLLLFVSATYASTQPEVGIIVHDASPVIAPGPVPAGTPKTLTVTLTFDFSQANACTATVVTGCVKQFNFYLSGAGGAKTLLFSVPAPSGAATQQTLTVTSPTVNLSIGNNTILATVATPDPLESTPLTVTVPVPPNPLISCTITPN